jgi:hypothetical protein
MTDSQTTAAERRDWEGMSEAERHVFRESLDHERLVDVLNGWVPMPDAEYWNRKAPYVLVLAVAAKSLVSAGLVDVYRQVEGGNVLLTRSEALTVVAEPGNWWRYLPDTNWDPNEPVVDIPEPDDAHPFVMYWVDASQFGLGMRITADATRTSSGVTVKSRGGTADIDLSGIFVFPVDHPD